MTNNDMIKQAVEVAKESARGGNASPDVILERVYNQIKTLDLES